MNRTSKLVGRVISGFSEPNDRTLVFRTDAGEVKWSVDGDCCSESLFTDVRINDVIGRRITKVRELNMVDPLLAPGNLTASLDLQDVEQVYGLVIEAGDASGLIVHRNYSNGYYGGSLSEDGEWAYGWNGEDN